MSLGIALKDDETMDRQEYFNFNPVSMQNSGSKMPTLTKKYYKFSAAPCTYFSFNRINGIMMIMIMLD